MELFYVESGAPEYRTLRERLVFREGSAGFVNAGVYHMTRAVDEERATVQLCHIFRPALLEDVGGLIARCFVRPLVEARQVEVISWDPARAEDAPAIELVRRSFELGEKDDPAYELRLRSALSDVWALALERARPLMEAPQPSTPPTATCASSRCAPSCTTTTPSP